MKMNGNSRFVLHSNTFANLHAAFARRTLAVSRTFTTTLEYATMVKKASTPKRPGKATALTAVGAAGLGLSLVGSASASTIPAADLPQSDNAMPNQRFVLGEEEMADVSLATFHLFDRENVGGEQLAVVVVHGRCGGCRGCRGWRGCRCGGCRGCGGCCRRWGHCRWC
jgi:hypothetical protein